MRVENVTYVKKIMFGILLHVVMEMIIYDSAIMCDESIESCDVDADTEAKSNGKTKTIRTNFNKKKATCKMSYSITIALLITVSIYCYLIKYWVKQKIHFQFTNNK